MVTDPEVAVVYEAVDLYVRMFERTREVSFRPGNRVRFGELTDGLVLEPRVRPLGLSPVDLHSTAAAALLGPSRHRPLPAGIINAMIESLEQREPDQAILLRFVPHFVLAYGVDPLRSWDQSFEELKLIVWSYMTEVNEWLQKVVPGVRDTFYVKCGSMYVPIHEVLRPEETARELALKLVSPVKKLVLNPGQEMIAICEGEIGRVSLPGMDWEWEVPLYAKQVFSVPGGALWESAQTGKSLPIADGGKIIVSMGDEGMRIETRAGNLRPGLELQYQQSARLRGASALDIWECTCGNEQCLRRHWQQNWHHLYTDKEGNQHDFDLHCFVATAMKGPGADGERASQAIYPNAYVSSLHYSHMNRLGP
jgi:hypothetical protein